MTEPDDVPTEWTRRTYRMKESCVTQPLYAEVVADAYQLIKTQVLREAVRELEEDHQLQGGEGSGQHSVGMRRCMLLLCRMANEAEGTL